MQLNTVQASKRLIYIFSKSIYSYCIHGDVFHVAKGEASHGAAALLQPVTWSGFSPGGAEIIFRSALVTSWT